MTEYLHLLSAPTMPAQHLSRSARTNTDASDKGAHTVFKGMRQNSLGAHTVARNLLFDQYNVACMFVVAMTVRARILKEALIKSALNTQ